MSVTKPIPMSTTDVATGITTYHVAAMDAAQIWRSVVALASTKARQSMPASNTRIDKAIEYILNNAVEILDGTAYVRSQQGDKTIVYKVEDGICECPDFERAPEHWCKHRLARAIYLKAMQEAKHFQAATSPLIERNAADMADLETDESLDIITPEPEPEPEPFPTHVTPITLGRVPPTPPPAPPAPAPAPAPAPDEPRIPAKFIVPVAGRPFVLFVGLLDLATKRGLVGLTEAVTHVTESYVLATATATFSDGRVFTGFGDATPDNVGAKVKPSWRRMAGTRAKARALRDALNVAMCSFEELEGGSDRE